MSDTKDNKVCEVANIDLKDIRIAVADAASVSSGLWLSYLFVMLYLLVATGGVTHRDLFLESRIKLPFLSDTSLPLKGFFWLGPLIFLVVHAYVLLHFVMLAEKVRLLNEHLPGNEDRPGSWPRQLLPANIFIQLLAGPWHSRSRTVVLVMTLVVWVSLVIGPVALLVFFELKFLPYHDEAITWFHRLAVLIDLGLLWTLWPIIFQSHPVTHERSWLDWSGIALMAIVSFSSAFLVFAIATFPGERLEQTSLFVGLREGLIAGSADERTLQPSSLFSNRLILPGQDLVDHAKYGSAARLAAGPAFLSLRNRNLEQAVLTDSNLPRTDFNSANLRSASFTRARVQGAWFDRADLSGAQFDSASAQGASFYQARLVGAYADNADLQGASFAGAQMQGAWLQKADFEAASLASADLRWAILDGATLRGSNLYDARLQGASFRGAKLQGASLEAPYVWRTDFRGAEMSGPGPRRLHLKLKETGREDPPCLGPPKDACDASDTPERIRHVITHYVPESSNREQMLNRLWLDLKSSAPPDWDQESARQLDALNAAGWREDDNSMIDFWYDIACAGTGAPFILAALVNTLHDPNAYTVPRRPDISQQLIGKLLKETCTAWPVINDEMKMRLLDVLRGQVQEANKAVKAALPGQAAHQPP